jgi:hypothetical protein
MSFSTEVGQTSLSLTCLSIVALLSIMIIVAVAVMGKKLLTSFNTGTALAGANGGRATH